jgi:hypothetical protein
MGTQTQTGNLHHQRQHSIIQIVGSTQTAEQYILAILWAMYIVETAGIRNLHGLDAD